MTAVQQRAWWVLAAIAVMVVVFGATDVLMGAEADPGISLAVSGMSPATLATEQPDAYRMFDFVTRSQGILLAVFGLLLLVVITIPYRAAQPWAWRAMWLLPAWAITIPCLFLAFGTVPAQPPAPPMISGPIVAVASAATLVLDRGRIRGR